MLTKSLILTILLFLPSALQSDVKIEKSFIVFYADWCIPCKDFEKEYTKPEFKETLKRNGFTFRKCNVDQETNTDMEKRHVNYYKVDVVPSVVMRSQGHYEIYIGYNVGVDELIQLVDTYPHQKQTSSRRKAR